MKKASHYDILGVSETADVRVIKDAYHKASRKLHPDKKNSSNNATTIQHVEDDATTEVDVAVVDFERIKTAWECLRDPDSRRRYDQERSIALQSTQCRRASAIILTTADCHPFTLLLKNDNEDEDGTSTSTVVLAYTCRCGMELDTTNPPPLGDDDDNGNDGEEEEGEYDDDDGLMDCPGCSLVYDTSRVGSVLDYIVKSDLKL
jgi:curved DNA-binding protein CbpA